MTFGDKRDVLTPCCQVVIGYPYNPPSLFYKVLPTLLDFCNIVIFNGSIEGTI